MLSIQRLFESSLPYRPRAEVFIIKDGKLIVGVPHKGWTGYVISGGGIERGEDPAETARRETLEEFGVSVKNLRLISKGKKINYNDSPPTGAPPKMKKYIEEMRKKHSGGLFYTFVGDYDGINKKLYGTEPDTYKIKEINIDDAIRFFKQHSVNMKKINDLYNHEKAKYIVDMLNKIKRI